MKVLIVAPAWVGDMVMAHCLLQRLVAEHGAGLTIHLLAPPATAPLGERMAEVAHTHVFDLAHGELGLRKRRAYARTLATEGFDQALVLPNSFKSALVPFWANIKTRTGWSGELRLGLLNDRRKLDPEAYPLMIERFMALAMPPGAALPQPYPQPCLQADAGNGQAQLLKHQLASERSVLALCPGAEFGPAKRWPDEHFAAVAADAIAAGYDVWLFGSPKDAPVATAMLTRLQANGSLPGAEPGADAADRLRIEHSGQQVVNLAGQTTLLDAIDLLALTQAVVCNDSGLMHVAAALGRRVVALYGSTSPDFTPPLSAQAQVLRQPLPCSPCFQRTCPLGHMNCLRQLSPERVSRALAL